MKNITKNTRLKLIIDGVEKQFVPVERASCIFWRDDRLNFIAQAEPKLEGLPVVSFEKYQPFIAQIRSLYTLEDIKKAIRMADIFGLTSEQIIERINSIDLIIVDEKFNILSYE